ncbi:MAG: hypothetical protein C4524_03830 [Candidatus Zixiibacteriota bacterium]|nr:MAG: hypothetical protein C4524_03830 [candidate division Zixibacteria bacterium]
MILALLCLSAGVATALEGWYTEEEVRFPAMGQTAPYTIVRRSWYTDDCMRKDEEWKGITIARFDQDRIYYLEPGLEGYFEITPEMLQRNALTDLKAFGAVEDSRGKLHFPEDLFVRTETRKRIGPWDTYQVMTNPIYRDPQRPYMVLWYSHQVDFPVQLLGNQLRQFFGDSPEVKGLFERIRQFEGYPVRTEAHGLGGTVVTTLRKVEYHKDIDPSMFEVPENYHQLPTPDQMPGMRPSK